MRVAFVTPEPWSMGAMPGVATQVVRGLVAAGHDVDCYVTGDPNVVGRVELVRREHLCVVDPGFRHGQWYSRRRLSAYASELTLRAVASYELARVLSVSHRRQPYDVVYRHSTIELHGLGRHLDDLPPIVVQPGVHAGGELRWLRRESALAAQCTPPLRNAAVRGAYAVRARLQTRDARRVAGMIAASRHFRDDLVHDYGVDGARSHVVPFPVDVEAYPAAAGPRPVGRPVEVLYAGRIAVRKGIDDLVAVSHRLRDLAGRMVLRVVGHPSPFSDYRPLLAGLDPAVAVVEDARSPAAMPATFQAADLCVVPSKFEPFGLTAAEALSSGTPVVATTVVGATEDVPEPACHHVAPGDVDALADTIRALVARIEQGDGPALRAAARAEAERRFAPSVVVPQMVDALEKAAAAAPARIHR